MHVRPPRILLVDLNNFSMYPTMAVGYLASILRREGMHVNVLSPLAYGVSGLVREPPETFCLDIARRANYLLEQAPGAVAARVRKGVASVRSRSLNRDFQRIGEIFDGAVLTDYDVVLVSTYLMYYEACEEIGRACEQAGVPLVVGGSYFAEEEVARSWLSLPGLSALVGGEVELELPEIIYEIVDGGDASAFAGVWTRDSGGRRRPPLLDLDDVPFPDYSDFPWDKYRHRIIPLITGRGCGWGACTFCSDVTSTAGRTFRSRSPENVLQEVSAQQAAHQSNHFVFTDLKLNSNVEMVEAIAGSMAKASNNAKWVGSVHVGIDGATGIDRVTLNRLRASGAVRLTTGLESGSQRVLDALAKGTDLAVTSRFLWDASEAGLSIRVTMIHGSPGETAQDVEASARFLSEHESAIDRVSLNRFQAMMGPTLLRRYDENAGRYPSLIVRERIPRMAYVESEMPNSWSPTYVMATQKLLGAVHRINKKKLPAHASEFDGVM